jgi:hypothetical protein
VLATESGRYKEGFDFSAAHVTRSKTATTNLAIA